MRRETQAGHADIRVEAVLDILHLDDGLHAYSLVRTARDLGGGGGPPRIRPEVAEGERQGIVDAVGLDALRRGEPHADLPLVVATPGFLESMRRGGFRWLQDEGFRPLHALRGRGPFETLLADPAAASRLVRVDTAAECLLDAKGSPLPCAVAFDLASAPCIDDVTYDLEAVADALDGRADVTPLDADGRPADGHTGGFRAAIHEVPWSDEPRRAIAFLWGPDREAHARAWEAAVAMPGAGGTDGAAARLHRAVIEADVLGIADARLDAPAGPRR